MSDLVKLFFSVIKGSIRHARHYGHRLHFWLKVKRAWPKNNFSPQSWVRNFFLVKLETLYYQLVKKSDPPHGVLGHGKNALYYRGSCANFKDLMISVALH